MKKSILLFAVLISTLKIVCQDKARISASGEMHLNHVIYDPVMPYNNTTGRGFGLLLGLQLNTAFKPLLELDYDRYHMGPQEMVYITYKGKNAKKTQAFNFYGGVEIDIFKGLKMEFLIGPSFLDDYKYFAFKPAILYAVGKNERFFGRISFTCIRTVYGESYELFEYLGFSAGIKIF